MGTAMLWFATVDAHLKSINCFVAFFSQAILFRQYHLSYIYQACPMSMNLGRRQVLKKTPQKPQGVWILELKYNFSTNFETNELVKTSKVQKNYTFITFSTSHT